MTTTAATDESAEATATVRSTAAPPPLDAARLDFDPEADRIEHERLKERPLLDAARLDFDPETRRTIENIIAAARTYDAEADRIERERFEERIREAQRIGLPDSATPPSAGQAVRDPETAEAPSNDEIRATLRAALTPGRVPMPTTDYYPDEPRRPGLLSMLTLVVPVTAGFMLGTIASDRTGIEAAALAPVVGLTSIVTVALAWLGSKLDERND